MVRLKSNLSFEMLREQKKKEEISHERGGEPKNVSTWCYFLEMDSTVPIHTNMSCNVCITV